MQKYKYCFKERKVIVSRLVGINKQKVAGTISDTNGKEPRVLCGRTWCTLHEPKKAEIQWRTQL